MRHNKRSALITVAAALAVAAAVSLPSAQAEQGRPPARSAGTSAFAEGSADRRLVRRSPQGEGGSLGVGWLAPASTQGPLQAELAEALVRSIDRIAAGVDGVVGYAMTDLTTGQRVAARLETVPFPTASTIKLSILYELFKQSEAGTLAIDTPAPLQRADVAGGSGVLQHLENPSLSLLDHAALMIILSDNTSTNVVIKAVGMEQVNARATSLGMKDIRLRRLMMDAAAVERGDENVASPASLARSAEVLWKGDGLDPAGKDAALAILRLVNGQIRRAVPPAVTVYSKTGSLNGVRAEAAVVDVPGRPFSIAVMTTYLAKEAEGERAIGEIAAAAYGYFDRIAKGGEYGRNK